MMAAIPLAGAAMGGLSGLFGTPDYSKAYNQYADQMQNIAGGYTPYIRSGAGAEAGIGALSAHNMMNPAQLQNQLASSFQNSPYQNQMQQNTSRMMDANAAQTGMLGSTSQNAALQNSLAGQQNQWQQQYINRGTQQYNQNLQNLQRLGMMMGQQGYGAFGKKQGALQEGALSRLQGQIQPSGSQNALTGAIGGLEGGLGAAADLSMMGAF